MKNKKMVTFKGDFEINSIIDEMGFSHEEIKLAMNIGPERQRELGEHFGKAGWTWHSINDCREEHWDRLLKTIGSDPDDYIILTKTRRGNGFCRGQIVVSPIGRIRALKSISPSVSRIAREACMRIVN